MARLARAHGDRTNPAVTAEMWSRARDLVAAGYPIREAAHRTGINRHTLAWRVRKEGWYRPSVEAERLPPMPHELRGEGGGEGTDSHGASHGTHARRGNAGARTCPDDDIGGGVQLDVPGRDRGEALLEYAQRLLGWALEGAARLSRGTESLVWRLIDRLPGVIRALASIPAGDEETAAQAVARVRDEILARIDSVRRPEPRPADAGADPHADRAGAAGPLSGGEAGGAGDGAAVDHGADPIGEAAERDDAGDDADADVGVDDGADDGADDEADDDADDEADGSLGERLSSRRRRPGSDGSGSGGGSPSGGGGHHDDEPGGQPGDDGGAGQGHGPAAVPTAGGPDDDGFTGGEGGSGAGGAGGARSAPAFVLGASWGVGAGVRPSRRRMPPPDQCGMLPDIPDWLQAPGPVVLAGSARAQDAGPDDVDGCEGDAPLGRDLYSGSDYVTGGDTDGVVLMSGARGAAPRMSAPGADPDDR